MAEQELGALVKRYRQLRGVKQDILAERLSQIVGKNVHQSQVSENMHGARWNNPELPAAYVQALDIPLDEMLSAMGYPDPPKSPKPTTLADLVRKDMSLTAAAKKHLLAQYKLLQLASVQELAGKPVLAEPR